MLLFGLAVFLVGCPKDEDTPAPALVDTVGPDDTGADSVEAPPDASHPDSTTPELANLTVIVGARDNADPTVLALNGVISGPDPSNGSSAPNLALALADIGVLHIKNGFYFDGRLDLERVFSCPTGETWPSWEFCHPGANDAANYNWPLADVQFQSYLTHGFEPLLRLGGEAENEVKPYEAAGPQNADEEANWISAATQMVSRYDNWDGEPGQLQWVQLWTEFPNADHWDRDNAAFIDFWLTAAQAITTAQPAVSLGGPGFSPEVTGAVVSGTGGVARELLTASYEAGYRPAWVGWHLYSDDPTDFFEAARAWRQLLEGKGAFADVPWKGDAFFADTKLAVDAYGTATVMEKKQAAATLTGAWIALQHQDVERAYLDRCGDRFSDPADPTALPERGLFFGTGAYKRAAHVVRLWRRVADDYPHKLATDAFTTTFVGARLWHLAAESDAGVRAILVANAGDTDLSWTTAFGTGAKAVADHSEVTIFTVDNILDGKNGAAWAGGTAVTTPAQTVQLVILTP